MSIRLLGYISGIGLSFLALSQSTLSLSDAINMGLERNFDIQIESKNNLIAENNNNWGEAGRYPTISLGLNQNNSITDNVKTASPFQLQDQVINNSLNPTVNVNWVIFNGFSVNINKRRLEQIQAETKGNASIVVANTLQAIILGYYNVVLQYERLTELERQMEFSRDRMDYIIVKEELGSALSTDKYVEEGNFLTDSINFINQQLVVRNAMRNLNLLMNEDDLDAQYILTDNLDVSTPSYELEDLIGKMRAENVDIKKQYLTQSVLGSNVELARAGRYPTFSMNAGAGESRSSVNLSNASFPNSDGSSTPGPSDPINAITDSYSANFSLSFTLFNGGKIKRAIRNAIVLEDIGNVRIEKLEYSLERDLRETLDLYNIRQQIYQINERREEVARINLEVSEDKFRNGSINSFDFRIIQNNYLSSVILKLQAKFSLIDSHLALMRLTGGLIEEYQ